MDGYSVCRLETRFEFFAVGSKNGSIEYIFFSTITRILIYVIMYCFLTRLPRRYRPRPIIPRRKFSQIVNLIRCKGLGKNHRHGYTRACFAFVVKYGIRFANGLFISIITLRFTFFPRKLKSFIRETMMKNQTRRILKRNVSMLSLRNMLSWNWWKRTYVLQ